MNIAMWILAGAMVGWIAFTVLHLNEARGALFSIAIGAFGGILGGKMVAPIFVTVTAMGEFSMSAMLIAGIVAAVLLVVANLVQNFLAD